MWVMVPAQLAEPAGKHGLKQWGEDYFCRFFTLCGDKPKLSQEASPVLLQILQSAID